MQVKFWQKRSKFSEFKSFENIIYKFQKFEIETSLK